MKISDNFIQKVDQIVYPYYKYMRNYILISQDAINISRNIPCKKIFYVKFLYIYIYVFRERNTHLLIHLIKRTIQSVV